MIAGSLSRRYARALLAIGIDEGRFEELGQQLERVAALVTGHKDLGEALDNPSYPLDKRKAVMADLAGRLNVSKTIANFLQLAIDRNRAGIIPDVAREYRTLADEQAGRVRAEVKSAEQLDKVSSEHLKRSLEQKTGKQVVLTTTVDPELIAGTVTKIGSVIYDGSIKTRLEQMRDSLLAGKL